MATGKFKNVIGLYKSDPSKGKSVLHGKTREAVTIPAGTKVWVFKNDRKEKDSHPDYNVSIIIDETPAPSQSAPTEGGQTTDDLPF